MVKRKYNSDYLRHGFIVNTVNGIVVPQCVLCMENLSNDALRPSRLKRHLQTKHYAHKDKPLSFFQSKKDSFKKTKMRSCDLFRKSFNADAVLASFEISYMIAKAKKPHNIGETLIKPCLLRTSSLMLGETHCKKLSKISLSNSTVKTRIDEISNDILAQILEKVQKSSYYSIQCDETTDVSQLSQLLVYIRFIGSSTIEEEMLFCKPLKSTTRAIDIFNTVESFFEKNNLKWNKLVGVCTDGAPSMIGARSGFISKIKNKNPHIVASHCVIHREALASRTMPE